MIKKSFHISSNLFKKGIFFFIFFIWILVLSKKMDWVFFPYNNMFASSKTQLEGIKSYGLKKNDTLISISQFSYWKKDLLEQSIAHYAYYISHDNKQYTDIFFQHRKQSGKAIRFIGGRLQTPPTDFEAWSTWYLKQAKQTFKNGDSISLIMYHWKMVDFKIKPTDSITLKAATL
jgi:hypothetical protein